MTNVIVHPIHILQRFCGYFPGITGYSYFNLLFSYDSIQMNLSPYHVGKDERIIVNRVYTYMFI